MAAARFHAFISYSHAADSRTAAALQSALQRIGKRWYARSTVRVFRDQTSLAAAPSLWTEIERHLAQAEWFVLMASPAAAQSPWVGKEVQWWLQHRSAARMLIVLTDGTLAWDAQRRRFAADGAAALPPGLHDAWQDEPLWVDLRWAAAVPHLGLRHSRFRDAALTLAARLHGRPKDELDSAEIREHRRLVAAGWIAGLAFNLLLVAAGAAWWQARAQQQRAEHNWREAQSRRLAAMALESLDQGRLEDAAQLAVLAWRLDEIGPASAALRRVVASGSGVAGVLGQHTGGVAALAFSGDSRLLVSGGRDGSLMRWRSADWQREGPLLANVDTASSESDRALSGVQVDAAGEHVFAWKRKGSGWWWQPRSGRVQRLDLQLQDHAYLRNAAIAPAGAQVLLVLHDKAVSWRPADGTRHELRAPPSARALLGGCLVADDRVRLLAATQRATHALHNGLRIFEWQPASRRTVAGDVTRDAATDRYHVLRAGAEPAWAADCSQFVLWHRGQPTVWSVDARLGLRLQAQIESKALADPHTHGDVVAWFVGRRAGLAAHDADRPDGVRWAPWAAGEPTSPSAMPLPGAALPIAASPDGRWLAAAGGESLVLWDSRAGPWGSAAARRLAVSCRDVDEQCAARLCQALARRFDETQLRKLFGIANYEYFYDTYRHVVDAAACPPEPREPLRQRPLRAQDTASAAGR